MKTAIVFDSAGTLLKVYRVAWDIARQRLVENVVSTNMISKGRGCVLIALRVDSADFVGSVGPDVRISDYMTGAHIGFDIICRGMKCTPENITRAVARDRLASMGDLRQAIEAVKLKCKDIYYLNIGLIVDVPAGAIPYVLATGGRTFPGVKGLMGRLIESGVDVYVASGDNRKSLTAMAADMGIAGPNVFDAVTPEGKMELVKSLKGRYDKVFMVGDGVNDYLALRAADVGILSLQQEGMRPDVLFEASDVVVDDILDIVDILEAEGVFEESLHTGENKNTGIWQPEKRKNR